MIEEGALLVVWKCRFAQSGFPGKEDAVKDFVARFGGQVIGALNGLDRMVFRGTLRAIAYTAALELFLRHRRILLKDFGAWGEKITEQVRVASEQVAREQNRPTRYLSSSTVSKEDVARELLRKHPIDEGLICVLSCVEP